jgi:hypothetical protein
MLIVHGHSNHQFDLESHSSWNLLHESGTMNLYPCSPCHKDFLEWVGDVKNKVEDELRRVITQRLNVKRELFLIVHKFVDLETWRRIYTGSLQWLSGSTKEKYRHDVEERNLDKKPPFIPLEVRADLSLLLKATMVHQFRMRNPGGIHEVVECYVGICMRIVI